MSLHDFRDLRLRSYHLDTRRKLSVHKTLRRSQGRLLNELSFFNLRPVSRRKGGGEGEIYYMIPISHSSITRIIWYNIMLLDRHIWRKEKKIPYKRTHSWTSKSIKWELVSISWVSQELSLSPLLAYLIFNFFWRIFAFKCNFSSENTRKKPFSPVSMMKRFALSDEILLAYHLWKTNHISRAGDFV